MKQIWWCSIVVRQNKYGLHMERQNRIGYSSLDDVPIPLPPRRAHVMLRRIEDTGTWVVAMYCGKCPEAFSYDNVWPWQHLGFYKPTNAQALAYAYLRMCT